MFSRFLFELSKITHYEQRLRTLHYKKKFNIWYAELKPKIVAVLKVGLCKYLKNFDTNSFIIGTKETVRDSLSYNILLLGFKRGSKKQAIEEDVGDYSCVRKLYE